MHSASVIAVALSWTTNDTPTVDLFVQGPKGGNRGGGMLTPAEARRVAHELLMEADHVERGDPVLNYRGFKIDPFNTAGDTVEWHLAIGMTIRDDTGACVATTTTLNQAKEWIDAHV